jgi:predicted alpha/beta hydrolase family esterase
MQVRHLEFRQEYKRSVEREETKPHVVIVPGSPDSDPNHWQSHWEILPQSSRADLGGSGPIPQLHEWVPALDQALGEAPRPAIVVAHDLGCLTLGWWAALRRNNSLRANLTGALLVAPPDVDAVDANDRIRDFRPMPRVRLPFRTILVASRSDRFATYERSRAMAAAWGSELVDAGDAGHLDARSRLGEWSFGLKLLARLMGSDPDRLVAEFGLRAVLR